MLIGLSFGSGLLGPILTLKERLAGKARDDDEPAAEDA